MDKAASQELRTRSVFLAHSSGDKVYVRDFYRLLRLDGFEPWLDEENLVPGHHWELEVGEALRNADAIVVFLSSRALDKAGYVHKEIRVALEAAERLPEGSILLIPVVLDHCRVPPSLQHLHWLDASSVRWRSVLKKYMITPKHLKDLEAFSIGEHYLRLQMALSAKAHEPNFFAHYRLADYEYEMMMGRTSSQYRVIEYLVRGRQSGSDSYYYGLANMKINAEAVTLRTTIGATVHEYEGRVDGVRIQLTGAHAVEYWMSYSSNLLVGAWGDGGLEELIPARERRFSGIGDA